MNYYCDCRNSKGDLNISNANLGRGKMQPTKISSIGLCLYCGYIPVISREAVDGYHSKYRAYNKMKLYDKTEIKYIKI